MRLLLLLLLVSAAPAGGQVPPEPLPLPHASPVASQQERGETVSAEDASVLPLQLREPALRAEEGSAAGAVQPSMRNFLYQILITAVSALVTALIWKAVF